MPPTHIASLTRAEWDALARRTMFFGHQSVGENIIDGLRKIERDRELAGAASHRLRRAPAQSSVRRWCTRKSVRTATRIRKCWRFARRSMAAWATRSMSR